MQRGPAHRYLRFGIALFLVAFALTACRWVIEPPGERTEREKAERARAIYAVPVEKRPLPELTTSASLPSVLEYAFNASGNLEMAYREWRAAIERIPQAGALPNTRLDFRYMLSAENMKSFGGALSGISVMVEQEFPARAKREKRAELALLEAQATGERFRAAKYRLQKQVVQAYADVALNEALLGQTSETLRLLRETVEVALHRFHAMEAEGLADLSKLEVEIQTVESEQRSLQIARGKLIAELHGVLNRPPDAKLGTVSLPEIRESPEPAPELFARAVRRNPELAALQKEIEARGAGQVLAELEKKRDYSVGGGLEQLSPAISLSLSLPLNRARIRAGIAEALALRESAGARFRDAASDVQARVVMALAGISDADRILSDYRDRIIPKARELLRTQINTYGSGGGDILDILDTERLLVDFRKLTLRAEADRLRFLAELEEAVGDDLFNFVPAGQKPQEPHP